MQEKEGESKKEGGLMKLLKEVVDVGFVQILFF